MSAQIIPFPRKISRSFDVVYGWKENLEDKKRFIRGVIRDTYISRTAVAVSAGEDAACAALESDMNFYDAMNVARDAIERVEKMMQEMK